nr:hypothetical protein [Paracoccus sp. AK26]
MLIERDKMKMRVLLIISFLVVDRQNIASLSFCQGFCKSIGKSKSLLLICFDGQGHDEAFAYPALPHLRGVFSGFRLGHIGEMFQPYPNYIAGGGRSADISQMRGGLPNLCDPVGRCALRRERADRMSE